MRKIIGIGETILDILFIENQPHTAVPGGSVYNSVISLARMGCDVTFISETGNDHVGKLILNHMHQNGVQTDHVCVFPEGKSPISLAFINERRDAEYIFYKEYPQQRLETTFPTINRDDIVLMGSYFVLNPQLRPKVKEILEYARSREAIIYYDVNFRKTHAHEALRLMPTLLENFEYADIVRGSSEDFNYIFGDTDAARIYRDKIAFYCPQFICTDADKPIKLFTKQLELHYPVEPIQAVSTIGAGDNFNAGIVYALLKHRIRRDDFTDLTAEDWNPVIASGMAFSANVCQHYENSVSETFVKQFKS